MVITGAGGLLMTTPSVSEVLPLARLVSCVTAPAEDPGSMRKLTSTSRPLLCKERTLPPCSCKRRWRQPAAVPSPSVTRPLASARARRPLPVVLAAVVLGAVGIVPPPIDEPTVRPASGPER